jgi:tetratricopeptide (TPR) repeat protein
VTAQLINIGDGFHLWSESYDRTLDDLLAIQTEVAAHVAEALKGQLLGEEKQLLTKRSTENAEAHRLFLQGRYLWNRRSAPSLTNAIEYFNQAISRDPSYALAYAGLADCYVLLPYYAGVLPGEAVPKARAAAQTARELDKSLVEPHVTLAYIEGIFDLNWKTAEADFRHAIEVNPNYATAHHWFSDVLRASGKLAEAVAQIRQAHEIDPLSPMINAVLGDTLSVAGEGDSALALLKGQIALDPSFVPMRNVLGRVYIRKGKLAEAISELETAERLPGSGGNTLCDLGLAYARAGRTDEAQNVLRRMQDLQGEGVENRARIALVQHALGDDQRALDLLERAVDDRAVSMSWYQRSDFWNDLRANPRFQALLRKLNLLDEAGH